MGMKFATEISNIQRVGVIPYMGMKLKIHYFLLSFFKVIPYMGMKLLRQNSF